MTGTQPIPERGVDFGMLDNGKTYYYAGLDKGQLSNPSVGVTFKFGTRGRFGMGVTQ